MATQTIIMKPSGIKIFFLLLFFSSAAWAQTVSEVLDLKKHKIVIQFNSSDSVSQSRVTLQLEYIKASFPNAIIEVVCLGQGLDLVVAASSKARAAVAEWSAKGVVFTACNATMRYRNVRRSDLVPTAKVIPSGPVELTLKQEQGWAYFWGGE